MLYSENIHISQKGILFTDKDGRPLAGGVALNKALTRLISWWEDFWLMLLNYAAGCPIYIIRKFFFTLSGLKIGQGSKIHIGARFFKPSGISIGKGSIIGDHVFLDGRAPITIGDKVDIASQVLIYNSQHDIDSEDFRARELPVSIDDYTFIGPRAIILPGVKIGRGAVVAAGAVVTKDVNEFTVVGGVPAKVLRKRRQFSPSYNLGRTRLFQ
ncbi:MAG: acetyltransferase (isoleucine patch superfamily) [Microgenomates group bacterium GW2011_GWA2_44_7]|nr:MAG: acetyltransferase (isoleucine patch superfamily) [Microgenomates group bacterium GW2011_GWA2_44_7]KKT78367.1 MAG: acetyltransferase (isoleucine patch superfamily) [Microgenomates group bacterium GW2011_GWB1_44_8]